MSAINPFSDSNIWAIELILRRLWDRQYDDSKWDIKTKQCYIESIMDKFGRETNPIGIVKNNDETYEIFDGCCRLNAINGFCSGEFPIERNNTLYWFTQNNKVNKEKDYVFSESNKDVFQSMLLNVKIYHEFTDLQKEELFNIKRLIK
tara:strand:+ start:401 stop:844 length:444 start_codon:yes stop_codon:yes gene_type:complete